MNVTLEFSTDVEAGIEEYGFNLKPLKLDLIKYFESNGATKPDYLGKNAPFTQPSTIINS